MEKFTNQRNLESGRTKSYKNLHNLVKPKEEIINPKKKIDLPVKIETPESSFEKEENETLSEKTFERIAEDSNGKIKLGRSEGYELFSCKFCDKSFSELSNMKVHLKVHAKIMSGMKEETEKLENHENQKSSSQIGKTFNVKDLIHRLKDLKCKVCSKSFITKEHLESHMKTHNKSFNVRNLINTLKDLKCSVCSKTFITKGQLISEANFKVFI